MKNLTKLLSTLLALMLILLIACNTPTQDEEIEFTGITKDDLNVNREDLISTGESRSHYFYIDESETSFHFDRETGNLSSISQLAHVRFDNISEYLLLSLDEMKQLADEFISHFIDPSSRRRVFQHERLLRSYDFKYIREVNGYDTAESSMISISYCGKVRFIIIGSVGMFDDVELPPIDEAELDIRFEEMFKHENGDVDFTITNRVLSINSNLLIMTYHFTFYDGNFGETMGLPIPVSVAMLNLTW